MTRLRRLYARFFWAGDSYCCPEHKRIQQGRRPWGKPW